MPRVKRGTQANKRRKNVLKHTKGFRWGRKSKFAQANQALQKAWTYSYRDRRVKKRKARQLFQTQISAASRQEGISYNKLIAGLKKNKIELDRKILSQLANQRSDIFKQIIEKVNNK